MKNYTDINAETIDSWVSQDWEWGRPVTPEEFARAKKGDWKVVLTPLVEVPKTWFEPFLKNGRLDGVKLLGLASGGAQQMPIFAALGADCTVLDYSTKQLESESMVAQREGYEINIVKADMTKPLPFDAESFDIIFHPVSNVYIEKVAPLWKECHRILRPGGLLLSGLDNGFNFLFNEYEAPLKIQNTLPFNPLKNPEQMESLMKDDNGIQFSHSFDEQIGEQLRAGFALVDAYEDFDDEPVTLEVGYPSYWATKAVKLPF